MKRLFAKIALVMGVAVMMTSCGGGNPKGDNSASAPQENGFKIKRGTNVSHWLSQSKERGDERRNHIQEDDFYRLDSLGFDHVRLPIDEEQLWDENGTKIPEAWGLLNNALDWARKYNLRTIVDLHIIRAHYFNAVNEGASNTLFTDSVAQQGLINLWYQLSDVLKDRDVDWVAYEFMNEPVAEEHEQWNQLVAKVHKALREREPNRTLVIGSNRWQGHETFKFLKVPEGDKNIILSFHYYNPMILTHYGAWWTPTWPYKGKVSYPGVLISADDYKAAPDSIKPLIEQYTTTEWNREKIHEQMKDAIEVAKSYGLQLFCGEWGVFEPVDRDLAYAWTKDMLSVFDEFDVAWTTWCYDADFGFWDQKKHDFKDKKLAELLTEGAKK
ncbi:MAG: glycoside hydrolase family 5 protein [Bacteroidales bacterium]|nr:glycoside hydrolase family 5 protein [Bacteroidales bacterium]